MCVGLGEGEHAWQMLELKTSCVTTLDFKFGKDGSLQCILFKSPIEPVSATLNTINEHLMHPISHNVDWP